MKYHEMYESALDFGDDLKIIVCLQCNRSMSVETTKNGSFLWKTLKIVNQGDFYSLHQFSKPGDISMIMISEVENS